MGRVLVMPGVEVAPVERKSEQLNLRLRPSERLLLQQEAERRGYRSPSEFAHDALVAILPHPTPPSP